MLDRRRFWPYFMSILVDSLNETSKPVARNEAISMGKIHPSFLVALQ